jgi:glycosyltransferase involved in cell wall biosynthesis
MMTFSRNTPDSPMRVAYLIPLLRGQGGWPTASVGIIRSLAGSVEPVLIVGRKDEAAAREIFPGAEVHPLPDFQPMTAGTLRTAMHMAPVWHALGGVPPLHVNLVHSLEMFPTGWAGDALASRERVPHVLTAYGTFGVVWHRWPLIASVYAGVLERAACVCPMSNGTADRMREAFGRALQRTTVEVVLHGSEFSRRVPHAIAEEKSFPEAPLMLSVGALKPRKGYHISLRAFGDFQRTHPDARYIVAGGGLGSPYHRELLAILEREGIRNVEFPGALSWQELDPLYRAASMLVMTSQEQAGHFEGFVFVFLEAGAYGLPVIGTRTGGIPDAVSDGRTGLLYAADDVAGIADGMHRLAEDRNLARRMGRNGRARAEELTWERYAAQQMKIYRRILSRKQF